MEFHSKHLSLPIVSIIASILSFLSFNFSFAYPATTTKVTVIEGRVMCFDLPKELISAKEIGQTAVGTFTAMINEETCIVNIKGKEAHCYIPREYRQQIENKLLYGANVYLVKNIRRAKQTEWDIVSTGVSVRSFQAYSNGAITNISVNKLVQLTAELANQQVSGKVSESANETSIKKTSSSSEPVSSISAPVIITQPELTPPPSGKSEEPSFSEPVIAPPAPEPETLTITTNSLSGGSEGTAYSQVLSASGGVTPYIWSLVSGSLPNGLSLSSSGIISGTPTGNTPGNTYSFNVKVTDSISSATKSLSIKISGYVTADWQQVNTSGFGSTDSRSTRSMAIFGNYLYTGTWNYSTGGQIWRSSDGTTWTQVNTGGFGDSNNPGIISMVVFNGYIYAGTRNYSTGGQIWRSSDGTTWTQANISGFSDIHNWDVASMAVFGNYIYAGICNTTTGTEVWRSSDGTTWTQVNTDGFGDSNNTYTLSMITFNGYIYAGTINNITGAEIWRSSNGTTWAQVNTNGFGNSDNTRLWSMAVFNNYIYAGTRNQNTGTEIWRSSDGTTWTNAEAGGFGNIYTVDTSCMVVFDNMLYIGTYTVNLGAEIWRSSDGTNWTQANTSGFGNSNNRSVKAMVTSGSYVYAGTYNNTTGCEVWRYYKEYIDPNITGRLYDSQTGESISNPIVSIYPKGSTTAIASSSTNPYSFGVGSGYYYIRVEKEGYTFPSNTKNGSIAGDHGEVFLASGTKMTIDIPLDKGYPLEITKTANKRSVVNGDIITYDIKIRNNSMWELLNINIQDKITNGFKYVSGSAYLDASQLTPNRADITGRKAIFKLSSVSGYKVIHLTYQVRVGTGISQGKYKTTAVAWDRVRNWQMSNETGCEVDVVADALFTLGTIIGKVFFDKNGNGIQDSPPPVSNSRKSQSDFEDKVPEMSHISRGETKQGGSPPAKAGFEEPGIAGVKIYTEYGVVVETDRNGKYHIPAVPPGTHLLKVDPSTLPKGAKFITENPYLVHITKGLLAKVNFGITLTDADIRADQRRIEGEGQKTKNDKFFIAALGEGIVRKLSTSGNIEMVSQDDNYDEGLKADSKLALYLKGKIKGKYLIEMSIDTERRPSRRGRAYQMRKLFTNLDPDKYYPVYGDASKIDYAANDTQDELYLLIKWDKSLIKWGAFNTDIPLYNRTLQGANIVYKSVKQTKFGDSKTNINAFYARAYQVSAHDEFIGTGGSLYYLRHTPVIEGGEKVRVELRDSVSKETIGISLLTEEKDYEIDYDTGRIILKKPLSSVNYNYSASIISNDILNGSRVYLVVDYEYESTNSIRREAYGIKASRWIGNYIKIGGTYIEEEKSARYYKLTGGDSTIKINKDTEVTAEYDRSEETQLSGAYSIDAGLSYSTIANTANDNKTGSSFNIKGKTKLFNNTDIDIGYSRADPSFSATNTITTQGSSVYTGSVLTRLRKNLTIGIKHLTQEIKDAVLAANLTGNNKVHTTTASLNYLPDKWDIRLEYQHQEIDNPFINYTYSGYRQLMDDDIIGGRIGYKLTDRIHPYIGGQAGINGYTNNQGYIGIEYQISDNTYLRIKETAGNLGNSTLLGLVSEASNGIESYTNIETGKNAQSGEDGRFIRTSIGQKAQIDKDSAINWQKDYSSSQGNILQGNTIGYETKLSDRLGIKINYERSQIEEEATAVSRDTGSIILKYLNIGLLKIFSKFELREDRGSETKRQWLTQNSVLYQFTEDISLSGRSNWSITDNRTQHTTEAQFHELGLGIAYRPINFDRLNLLAKYSYITNHSPESQNNFNQTQESIKNIYAVESAYNICRHLQLIGKFAMRDMSEKVGPRNWTDSQTYLYIGRLNFHITHKWDIAGEYRTLANRQIKDNKSGYLVEIDREIIKYLRFGIGYNFTDYDDDLSNDDNYKAEGWFIRINGKY